MIEKHVQDLIQNICLKYNIYDNLWKYFISNLEYNFFSLNSQFDFIEVCDLNICGLDIKSITTICYSKYVKYIFINNVLYKNKSINLFNLSKFKLIEDDIRKILLKLSILNPIVDIIISYLINHKNISKVFQNIIEKIM